MLMLARTYPVSGPLDLRRTLGPLSRGPGDPTIRLATGRAWWATRTRDGATSLALAHVGDELRVEAWGPGAERALDRPAGHAGARRRAGATSRPVTRS